MVAAAYLSEIIDSRVISTVILQIWALPLLVALYTFNKATSQWVYFVVVRVHDLLNVVLILICDPRLH